MAEDNEVQVPPDGCVSQDPAYPHVNHSGVNGSGLWRAWQRSFENKTNALLDLMDNAVDANRGHGRIRIITTPCQCNTENGSNEGILLLNSFPEASYREMSEILQVFESEKDNAAIGENGVGAKQAAAALSNFSVVVTRCDSRHQVGFLCTSLQTPERIELPSYTLEGTHMRLEHEIDSLCNIDKIFCLCLQYFGGRCVPSEPCGQSKETNDLNYDEFEEPTDRTMLQKGKDRLLGLLRLMSNPSEGWSRDYCVFALWLDQVRTQEPSGDMLEQLLNDLPKKYLHLKKDECDILINGKTPEFQYWERRLLQLTCFSIKISKTHPLSLRPDEPTEDISMIRVFVGFDPIRSRKRGGTNKQASTNKQACACLYIHSREIGRLVQYLPDCRAYLGLKSGGTDYAQGLTVILDDYSASLPLTPTKQAIAWSGGKNGDIHKQNVEGWLKHSVKVFYEHILSIFKQKGVLNKEVLRHASSVMELTGTSQTVFTPLADYKSFSRLAGCQWHLSNGELTTKKNHLSIIQGSATVMQMKRVTYCSQPLVKRGSGQTSNSTSSQNDGNQAGATVDRPNDRKSVSKSIQCSSSSSFPRADKPDSQEAGSKVGVVGVEEPHINKKRASTSLKCASSASDSGANDPSKKRATTHHGSSSVCSSLKGFAFGNTGFGTAAWRKQAGIKPAIQQQKPEGNSPQADKIRELEGQVCQQVAQIQGLEGRLSSSMWQGARAKELEAQVHHLQQHAITLKHSKSKHSVISKNKKLEQEVSRLRQQNALLQKAASDHGHQIQALEKKVEDLQRQNKELQDENEKIKLGLVYAP